jgi:hypothetical protein
MEMELEQVVYLEKTLGIPNGKMALVVINTEIVSCVVQGARF